MRAIVLSIMALVGAGHLFAQPWPREERFTADNRKRITDASVSIFNLHSDYDFPYVIPAREDVTEKLVRIGEFLESATMDELADAATGEPVRDMARLPQDFAFGKGDFRPYTYEWGVTYSGMLKAAEATGNGLFSDYVMRRMAILAAAYPQVKRRAEASEHYRSPLDGVVAPHDLDACGALCAAAARALAEEPALDLRPFIENSLKFISTGQYRLDDGTLARNRPYPSTLWLDDLYMSVPALAEGYRLTADETYLNDAVRQVLSYAGRMLVAQTDLFMHGWVESMHPRPAFYWGRANGWATLAMCDLLDQMPDDHPLRNEVMELFRRHCLGILRRQAGDGMWHQLLDRDDTYPESSATAMFVYGLAHGINEGWLDARAFGPATLTGWNALGERINNMGQIENVCVGTSVAFEPAYYYNRRVHPYTAHGYGPVLMAGSEIIRLVERYDIVQTTTIYFYDKKEK